jgi:hypothetical protein
MAPPRARYWVGGTGTWDPASTSWSTTSGGSPGAAAPLAGQNAIFDANSGGGTITVLDGSGGSGNPPECASLICTGFTGSIDSSGNPINVNGDVTLSSGGDFTLLYVAVLANGTFTSVGKSVYQIEVGAGTLTLADDLVNVSNGLFVYATFTTNNFNVTASTVLLAAGTLNMGSSTFTVSGAWNVNTAATINAGTSTINLTNTATAFSGGNQTYYNLNTTGNNTVSLSGNNTFNTISNSTQPITINFAAGSTQTVTNFNVSGTAGNLVTLQSTTSGTQFTLSKASGTVSRDYLSIKDSNATGGAAWYAGANSTNVSNNTVWTFSGPPIAIAVASRITSAGVLSIAGEFDEVTQATIRLTSTFLYSSEFDEYTLQGAGSGLAKRETSTGKIQVTGYFDEYNKPYA